MPALDRLRWILLLTALVVVLPSKSARAAMFDVSPLEIRLDDPEGAQQVLVSTTEEAGRCIDVTRQSNYRVEDPQLAEVDASGLVRPLHDGQTALIVERDGVQKRVPVNIEHVDHPRPISFPRDIVPILTKATCNMGGCHGKAEGQNGFKLSIFGFDPHADYEAIVQQSRGRRLSLAAPQHSLLLRKAIAAEPHGGGQRIELGDVRYRRLKRWIAEGAAYTTADVQAVSRIEIEPAEQVLLAGGSQQLRVWAIDTSGTRRCVTTEAEYESNAPTIAAVDGRGFTQASDIPGEAAILARYLGHVTVCRITIPRPGVKFPRPPEVNFVDHLAWDKLQRLGIEPSGLCDDATFVRRVYLDVIGTLPTIAEAEAFLADPAADKRSRLIDTLLDRPEYADYWTMRFSDLLRVDHTKITPQGAVAVTRWLRRQFSENRPYDAMVRELVTARGNLRLEGPAAYFKALDTPELQARSISQTFLGVRIECAQCHHHPSDRWSQDDYFAMANLFAGLTRKKLADGGESLVPAVAKELKHPRTGEIVAPHALGDEPQEFGPLEDRREYLARWMTDGANPHFATMIANRLWAHYFGRGLVEPIDDLRSTNPASNEPLLAALAAHMRHVNYDLKAFTRTLLASRLYQLSAVATETGASDDQNFSHAAIKALPAEVLLDAISQSTGSAEVFEGWPVGYRAIQIWDNKLPSYFFRIFGRPVRATVCECERSNEPSIAQALHLMNSPEIMAKISDRAGRAAQLAESLRQPPQIIEQLYLATLSRRPTPDEQTTMAVAFAVGRDRRDAAEDVLWALLNSKEFLYNH